MLKTFLLASKESREWTNNPVLEKQKVTATTSAREYVVKKVEESKERLLYSMSQYELEEYYNGIQKVFLDEHWDCCILESKNVILVSIILLVGQSLKN